MISTDIKMAQLSAVNQIFSGSTVLPTQDTEECYAGDFFKKEAAIALNRIVGGYVLLNAAGDVLLFNPKAKQILQKLQSNRRPLDGSDCLSLPEPILRACQSLLQNYEYLSDRSIPPQALLSIFPELELRISIIEAGQNNERHILIAMEDKNQASIAQAAVDQGLYGLTDREKDVWELRLMDYSYKEIAESLYLSVNTVKKYMKIILAKREQWQFEHEALLAS